MIHAPFCSGSMVEAMWTGSGKGEWILTVNGVDIMDKIPEDFSFEEDEFWLNVFGEYDYKIACEEWISKNRYWLERITSDKSVLEEIYTVIDSKYFRQLRRMNMLYVVKKEFEVNGQYEEPFYDEAPEYGSDTRYTSFTLRSGQSLEISERGDVEEIIESDLTNYYDSDYSGLYIKDNMKERIKAGFLVKVRNLRNWWAFHMDFIGMDEKLNECIRERDNLFIEQYHWEKTREKNARENQGKRTFTHSELQKKNVKLLILLDRKEMEIKDLLDKKDNLISKM